MAPVGHVHPRNVWECHFPLGSQKPKRSTMGGADRELRWHDISLIILEEKGWISVNNQNFKNTKLSLKKGNPQESELKRELTARVVSPVGVWAG